MIERSKPTLKIDDLILKSPFSVQRIRKAVKKSPRISKEKNRESGETNNRLTVQTWRSSERAGAIGGDVT